MSRICPRCGLAPRANDPMSQVQICGEAGGDAPILVGLGWPIGGYEVCHDCQRLMNPNTPPLRRPPNLGIAVSHLGGASFGDYLCTCCGEFARDDDPIASTLLRIEREDVDAHDELSPPGSEADELGATGMATGAIHCCRECFARWAPVVAERWKREGVVAPDVPWTALGRNMV